MKIDQLYVFNLEKVLIGRIQSSSSNPEGYEFKYAKSYLKTPDALAINPFHLPLSEKVYFSTNGFNGPLLSFNDSLPGAWGKAALNSIKGRKLTELEYLLENQQDRLGNLVFNTQMIYPEINVSRIKEPFEWEDILLAKEQFEKDNSFSEQYSELFKQGASQGGARPKLTVLKNGELYLAKLPSIRDYENNAQIEHGTLRLAEELGINVAKSSFFTIKKHADIFLTKRFDMEDSGKTPYLSMQSILGVESSFEASYGDFALALRRLNGGLDSLELFKRMVFNALISNHDDHFQNHAVYFKDGLWRLTPAFDVVAGEGSRRTLAISAGLNGGTPSIENIISESDKFGLDEEECKTIIGSMQKYIQEEWENVFVSAGIDKDVINSVRWAILHDFQKDEISYNENECFSCT